MWADAPKTDWVAVERERGITVSRSDDQGAALPAFRGEGVLQGNVLQMLSLMLDVKTVPRWAYGIREARALGQEGERTDYLYLYSDTPWPVRDRDMVVRRDIVIEKPGEAFRMELRCAPDRAPERRGVVRVRTCQSVFRLTRTDPQHTALDYQMQLDPGGRLPSWAGAWITKHVPLRTLLAIERETKKTASDNRYQASVRRWGSAL